MCRLLAFQIFSQPENVVRDKHSSLFCFAVAETKEEFITFGPVYIKILFIKKHVRIKKNGIINKQYI
jgi:hypothetical protein